MSVPFPGEGPFFQRKGPFPLATIKQAIGLPLKRDGSEDVLYDGVAPLHTATSRHISFLDNRRYIPLLRETKAGAVIMTQAFQEALPKGSVCLVSEQPYLAWSRVARLFHPCPPSKGVHHPTAFIGRNVEIGHNVEIGPFVTIGDGAQIGSGTVLHSHAAIGAFVTIGAHCRIGSHVSVSHALLGERVVLYPGARIGQDGFGFAVGPQGFESMPQLGRVVLEDGVEVGANSTIDRGSMKDTVVGAGSRIDNLVQIGHNVKLGRCCVVVAQAGISGSTELEDFVTVAAQAGLVGHIHIGTKARIAAQSGVMSDIDAGADVMGSPSMPFREYLRNIATLRKLSRKKRS